MTTLLFTVCLHNLLKRNQQYQKEHRGKSKPGWRCAVPFCQNMFPFVRICRLLSGLIIFGLTLEHGKTMNHIFLHASIPAHG